MRFSSILLSIVLSCVVASSEGHSHADGATARVSRPFGSNDSSEQQQAVDHERRKHVQVPEVETRKAHTSAPHPPQLKTSPPNHPPRRHPTPPPKAKGSLTAGAPSPINLPKEHVIGNKPKEGKVKGAPGEKNKSGGKNGGDKNKGGKGGPEGKVKGGEKVKGGPKDAPKEVNDHGSQSEEVGSGNETDSGEYALDADPREQTLSVSAFEYVTNSTEKADKQDFDELARVTAEVFGSMYEWFFEGVSHVDYDFTRISQYNSIGRRLVKFKVGVFFRLPATIPSQYQIESVAQQGFSTDSLVYKLYLQRLQSMQSIVFSTTTSVRYISNADELKVAQSNASEGWWQENKVKLMVPLSVIAGLLLLWYCCLCRARKGSVTLDKLKRTEENARMNRDLETGSVADTAVLTEYRTSVFSEGRVDKQRDLHLIVQDDASEMGNTLDTELRDVMTGLGYLEEVSLEDDQDSQSKTSEVEYNVSEQKTESFKIASLMNTAITVPPKGERGIIEKTSCQSSREHVVPHAAALPPTTQGEGRAAIVPAAFEDIAEPVVPPKSAEVVAEDNTIFDLEIPAAKQTVVDTAPFRWGFGKPSPLIKAPPQVSSSAPTAIETSNDVKAPESLNKSPQTIAVVPKISSIKTDVLVGAAPVTAITEPTKLKSVGISPSEEPVSSQADGLDDAVVKVTTMTQPTSAFPAAACAVPEACLTTKTAPPITELPVKSSTMTPGQMISTQGALATEIEGEEILDKPDWMTRKLKSSIKVGPAEMVPEKSVLSGSESDDDSTAVLPEWMRKFRQMGLQKPED